MNKNNKNTINFKHIIISLVVLAFCFGASSPVLASEITSENLIYFINQKRSDNNLPLLKSDSDLNMAATMKSKDMLNRDYFDHYSHGLTPWDFMKNSGYDYLFAGENLAMDFQTPEGMVNAWMNSTAHRENILNPEYTDIGFGIVKGEYTETGNTKETTIVTNMFGRKKPYIIKLFNIVSNNILNLF